MPELWELVRLCVPETLAMICLACFSSFFSASETALFYLSHEDLRKFRVGNSRQRLVAQLLSKPDRLLTAILFWNLVINLSYFAVSVVLTQKIIHQQYTALAGVAGIISVLGIIVFGEVIPKSVAVYFHKSLSTMIAWLLSSAVAVLDPVTPVLIRITKLLRRTFWPNLKKELHLEAADLERVVEASQLSAAIIQQERHILQNILDLSEILIEEVMRPRGTYIALNEPITVHDVAGEIPSSGYLILQEADSEQICSVVPLLELSSITDETLVKSATDVLFVPWCATAAYTLQMLREEFLDVACVVNEYGETIGIVTSEDIVDTFLHPQSSRTQRVLQRDPVLEIAPQRYHVDGLTTLRFLCRRLGMEYEPAADGQHTVGGLLHELLERIPEIGDECQWRGWNIKVFDVSQRGRLRVMVSQKS